MIFFAASQRTVLGAIPTSCASMATVSSRGCSLRIGNGTLRSGNISLSFSLSVNDKAQVGWKAPGLVNCDFLHTHYSTILGTLLSLWKRAAHEMVTVLGTAYMFQKDRCRSKRRSFPCRGVPRARHATQRTHI